ncbi:hypothetical protein SALBM311S_00698 [Streptomyces alboniger]
MHDRRAQGVRRGVRPHEGRPGRGDERPLLLLLTTFFEKTQVGYGAAISTVLTVIILLFSLIGLKLQTRAEDAEEGIRV